MQHRSPRKKTSGMNNATRGMTTVKSRSTSLPKTFGEQVHTDTILVWELLLRVEDDITKLVLRVFFGVLRVFFWILCWFGLVLILIQIAKDRRL